jgi:hypothetical protein
VSVRRKDGLDIPRSSGAWTRPDAYLLALASKRSFRRSRRKPQRSQPERPRLLLSTVPIALLLTLLGVLAIAIMIIAFPGNQPQHRARPAVAHEQGVAPRGWFEEAQKEMRR